MLVNNQEAPSEGVVLKLENENFEHMTKTEKLAIILFYNSEYDKERNKQVARAFNSIAKSSEHYFSNLLTH